MSVLQELHDSEINALLASFFADAWTVKLGDALNGFVSDASISSEAEAYVWLEQKALQLYPDSKRARARLTGSRTPTRHRSDHRPNPCC